MPDHHVRAALALTLVLLTAAPVEAAETGTIRGRVLNETTGEPQEGVSVTLTSALDDGSRQRAVVTTTDERGRYLFEDLPTGDDRYYAIDARHDDGLFAGGVVRLPEGTAKPPVIDSTLRVWDTTTDPAAIVVRRDSIFVVPSDDGAGVIEALVVANISEEAYIGRGRELGAEQDGEIASLGFAVPREARLPPVPIVESEIDFPTLVETSFGFAATTAIPPGQWRVVYSYEVPGDGGTYDLSRPALYPTLELGVYAGEPLRIEGGRVSPDGSRDVEGKSYDLYSSSGTLEAGDSIDMIAVAEASAGNLLAIGGIVAAVVVAAGALVFVIRRRSRGTAPEPPAREDVVEAIARLDLAKEQGLIQETEWASRRDALKRSLEEERVP
ncbi:MAG TPA: carboxypeptidase-like regulatory domain-containing protein [Actinomycetota bacterium]|nr:carboxypeptidase-like regulatory domain-containing protein [Actinomycetota bacterium]